jgi:hypothetical protein
MQMLGQLHVSQGEYAKAENIRRRAAKAPEYSPRVGNASTAMSFDNSPRLHTSQDKYSESANPYRTTNRRPKSGKDEVAFALREMLKTLEEVAEQTSITASGDYSARAVPRGDNDDVGTALSRLTETLREMDPRRRK